MIPKPETTDNIVGGLKTLAARYSSSAPLPAVALASVKELESEPFVNFMSAVNRFSSEHQLHIFDGKWSKTWEYPWLWFNGLSSAIREGVRVLDIGAAASPMPWLFALLGADVTIVEVSDRYVGRWERLRDKYGIDVKWHLVNDEYLPLADNSFDVITSFSVIEHQPDKATAIRECARVLRPDGIFALSFDLCEEDWGMTYPERLGKAFSIQDFRDNLWSNPSFGNGKSLGWHFDECRDFLEWHWENYVVGAAVFAKRSQALSVGQTV